MDMPWLVLGVVLGVLLVLLAGLAAALVLRRRAARPGDGEPAAEDDLPGFLESPPGSRGPAAPAGWAVLSPPAVAPPAPPARSRRDTVVVLTVMAVTALLLVGAAAAVAAGSRHDGGRGHAERPEAARLTARLTFGGVVLEPRAVGVTATYPVVEVTTDGERSSAQVEFPTFNCLAPEAPADPVAAGCTRSLTEYAELDSPDLVVDTDGDGLRISGSFPTEVRPNGNAPTPTGRTYDLRITVTPAGEGRGSQPADGVLELGPDRAVTTEGEIRSGS